MGLRYVGYRIIHELEKRLGSLKKKHPINPSEKSFISLTDWINQPNQFLIKAKEEITFPKLPDEEIKKSMQRTLDGEVRFFNYEWKKIGVDYDWVTNPDTGFKYDISKHWSEIPDLSHQAGDIKYVWEKSRFSYILSIIRNDYHHSEDHSEFVFSQIEDWINKNPINQGPNWRCSQEISLRILNWCYAIHYYRNSKAFTEKRWKKIQNTIYWSLHHVYNHINFSRIAVRNNHAITETLLLSLSNILFSFVPETTVWAKKGSKWFEEEIGYQIYEDGTFLQFSMNYHRVVIQLLSLGITIKELNGEKFSNIVYDRAYKSLDFLYQLLEEKNGHLPNYGSNDGALFFPLSSTDYRDYRPQLNTLHKVLTGRELFAGAILQEDSQWMCHDLKSNYAGIPSLKKHIGFKSYPIGGFYILRENNSLTFIRCGNHKDRPAHADNLHIDIWVNGENVLRDSGTYKYNTEKESQNFFTGTYSHNTVVVSKHSQMLKGSRFIWYYWTQALRAAWIETEDSFIFEGEISAYRFLNPKARHKRKVIKTKDKNIWIVSDNILGLKDQEKKQVWHHDDYPVILNAVSDFQIATPNFMDSYNSEYYGCKRAGTATFFTFNDGITTQIEI
mgnify:CR=1 FL=1